MCEDSEVKVTFICENVGSGNWKYTVIFHYGTEFSQNKNLSFKTTELKFDTILFYQYHV